MPQVELRFIFDLYAGVRPAQASARRAKPMASTPTARGIDLVVVRKSTEGLFASMGKGVVTQDEARETLVITRRTSRAAVRLFVQARGKTQSARPAGPASPTSTRPMCSRPMAFFRQIFDDTAARHRDVATDHVYVDACSALLVRRPWDFDVMVMENMFGDILSDLTAGTGRRHGNGAVGGYRGHPCRVPALPRHRPRHRRQGPRQPDRDDPVDRA